MTADAWPEWMTLPEAARYQRVGGEQVLRRAIKTEDPTSWPPPLPARQGSRRQYLIRRADLDRWVLAATSAA